VSQKIEKTTVNLIFITRFEEKIEMNSGHWITIEICNNYHLFVNLLLFLIRIAALAPSGASYI
jgi:hypothetical protein